MSFQPLLNDFARIPSERRFGRVVAVRGILIEVEGVEQSLAIGGRACVVTRDGRRVSCETVGFRDGRTLLMPFGGLDGIGLGSRAEIEGDAAVVYPHASWLGRVIDAQGQPIDGGPPLFSGPVAYRLRASPPPAGERRRVAEKLDLGVRALNSFLTCCRGQRMGIFSGSGVGKSILLSMLARHTESDVSVIGLVGERGREVREFVSDDLGPEGLKRSVVVVATSDESPLARRQAALLTLTISEYFRDLGQEVLCLIDSVTRFAMAQREIGLSAGEPPASKGYTPTVFAELPKLLERAGPGAGTQGNITGLFTVLVEGDDHNEPIADAVRGILDGHVVLDRTIAERGRYPAVNVLRSVSRAMPACNSAEETTLLARARRYMSVYDDIKDMVRLGAYRPGSDPDVDEAVRLNPAFEAFLAQDKSERSTLERGYAELARILPAPPKP